MLTYSRSIVIFKSIHNLFKISVLIPNTMDTDRNSPNKQKLLRILKDFKIVKGSQEPLSCRIGSIRNEIGRSSKA